MKAFDNLKKDDVERRKWGMQLYGIDTSDSRLYDMVINIHKLQVEDAVEILCSALKSPFFESPDKTKKKIDDITLAAKIHSMMIDYSLIVEVKVDNGTAYLSNVGEVLRHDDMVRSRIEKLINGIEGIHKVEILDKPTSKQDHVNPFYNIDKH